MFIVISIRLRVGIEVVLDQLWYILNWNCLYYGMNNTERHELLTSLFSNPIITHNKRVSIKSGIMSYGIRNRHEIVLAFRE